MPLLQTHQFHVFICLQQYCNGTRWDVWSNERQPKCRQDWLEIHRRPEIKINALKSISSQYYVRRISVGSTEELELSLWKSIKLKGGFHINIRKIGLER